MKSFKSIIAVVLQCIDFEIRYSEVRKYNGLENVLAKKLDKIRRKLGLLGINPSYFNFEFTTSIIPRLAKLKIQLKDKRLENSLIGFYTNPIALDIQ